MSIKHGALAEFIKESWGLCSTNIVELNEGSAQCYIIDTEKSKYFFKVYQEKFDGGTIGNEVFTCNFLSQKGFAVSCFLQSKNNTFIETFQNRLCTLQKYIAGTTIPKFQVNRSQLLDSIKVLAKLNIALEDLPIPLPVGFPNDWFSDWSANAIKDKHMNMLVKLNVNDEYYDKISADFVEKCKIIDEFNPDLYDFSALTVENTHGDYNTLQLIFDDNKVKAVIDFASCAKLPLCWEIIRSYTLSSTECKDGIIDFDNFVSYVREYMQIKSLSLSDLALMPYFYLFTLLRSTFGYKSYIDKRWKRILVNEKDLNALQFAFWRTSMCKWLFENAAELSLRLISLK